jgi:hypothetical protein
MRAERCCGVLVPKASPALPLCHVTATVRRAVFRGGEARLACASRLQKKIKSQRSSSFFQKRTASLAFSSACHVPMWPGRRVVPDATMLPVACNP